MNLENKFKRKTFVCPNSTFVSFWKHVDTDLILKLCVLKNEILFFFLNKILVF